jgi:four helix bundle protein
MQDFRNLKVWRLAHEVALDVYKLTQDFPKHEMYGLRSQIRRAVISIPTNVAEGAARGTDQTMRHFVDIALGSASEVEYLLYLSGELAYIAAPEQEALTTRLQLLRRMLNALHKRIAPRTRRGLRTNS